MPAQTNYRTGIMLTGIGGLALTFDIPLIRLADGEPWSILMLRTGSTFLAALVIWAVWRSRSANAPSLLPGWDGVAVATLYGIGSITFVTAVYQTSTANLVFLLAFTSMFAALLSWIFLRERPSRATLITMAVMIAGVLIIVADGLSTGGMFGNLLGLASALSIAAAISISRASGKDMGFTSLVGVIIPCVLAAIIVSQVGYSVKNPGWILLDGAVIMPISFFCLATGPKYLPSAEVAMFYLLETVMAPIWVWLIFSDRPTSASLAGGALLIAAIILHSIWQIRMRARLQAE